jgi:formamidopyrimidine-DNA glycosylase
MPELPEVEAVCRRLRQDALGAAIISAHLARPGICAPQSPRSIERRVSGQSIEGIERRGKHILIRLAGDRTLQVHLRMTGDLHVIPDVRFRPVTARAWFELTDGRAIIFNDPRALGRINLRSTRELEECLSGVGVEPLDPGFTPAVLMELAQGSRQPVKPFLLNQQHVAGIGNIYAAEALFEARIDPRTTAGRLSPVRARRLHAAIVGVLERAVQSACIAYLHPGRFGEAEWFPVCVYGRRGEPCERCGRSIRRIEQNRPSTYKSPRCQN